MTEIWRLTMECKNAHLQHHCEICTSFQNFRWIETWVTFRKRSVAVKIVDLSHVTLKFDGWPYRKVGHLFYVTFKFVHHCVAIDDIQLELRPGKRSIRVKIAIFVACNPDIWPMILKNNTVPLQACHFKLCTSLRNHQKFDARRTIDDIGLSGIL